MSLPTCQGSLGQLPGSRRCADTRCRRGSYHGAKGWRAAGDVTGGKYSLWVHREHRIRLAIRGSNSLTHPAQGHGAPHAMAASEAPHQPPLTVEAGLPRPAVEHRAPQTRADPEEPHSVGPSGIRTAGRARGCPLLQSHSSVAARYLVVGGPSIGGVRLQLRDNQPGAPLVDVQLYDEAGEWQVGTGLAGGATLRAYCASPGKSGESGCNPSAAVGLATPAPQSPGYNSSWLTEGSSRSPARLSP